MRGDKILFAIMFIGLSVVSLYLIFDIVTGMEEITFIFIFGEDEARVDGEVLIDEFIFVTEDGEITLENKSSLAEKSIRFLTERGGVNYSFEFVVPEDASELGVIKYVLEEEDYTESNLYYADFFEDSGFFHWGHMPLSYKVEEGGGCESHLLEDLEEAFLIIEDSSEGVVWFVETRGEPDITVICSDIEKEIESKKKCNDVTLSSLGEVNFYESVLNKSRQKFVSAELVETGDGTTTYNLCHVDFEDISFPLEHLDAVGLAVPYMIGELIINGTIYLNKNEAVNCMDLPVTELHETLHLFGFEHVFEEEEEDSFSEKELNVLMKDIMSPWASCIYQKELDEKYGRCLKEIYSGRPLGRGMGEENEGGIGSVVEIEVGAEGAKVLDGCEGIRMYEL